jgi:hypothetical protein
MLAPFALLAARVCRPGTLFKDLRFVAHELSLRARAHSRAELVVSCVAKSTHTLASVDDMRHDRDAASSCLLSTDLQEARELSRVWTGVFFTW